MTERWMVLTTKELSRKQYERTHKLIEATVSRAVRDMPSTPWPRQYQDDLLSRSSACRLLAGCSYVPDLEVRLIRVLAIPYPMVRTMYDR